jgi:putative adhesin
VSPVTVPRSTTRLTLLVAAVLLAFTGVAFLLSQALKSTRRDAITVTRPVYRIVVHSDAGDVRLTPAAVARVTVEQRRTWLWQAPTVRTTLHGGTLELTGRCPAARLMDLCETEFTLRVPTDVAVTVYSGAGAIDVRGLDGPLDLRSTTGEIVAKELLSESVRARTTAGDLRLGFISAPPHVDAETTSGDVDLALPVANYRIDASSRSGDVAVRGLFRDDLAPRHIVVRSRDGSVAVHPR